ncbi:hypothetical protein HanRHA438_Chr17g0802811 [Helianthus annuus]|nr:hypothetical protein HanHA89_Chr17g0697831 [Helianthus annuus]KAJ0446763.1 hypothetical protein HanHA89_Chr17g0697841 [Helianthus annuus]KAJ0825402.1 hypothetical protein HanRHA438_Chr17g0802801 [Helianthus annuus]KAJ0825403.1 hypothetical protein HanRHA438_Chr17g0802811 [Helianthus annuus]
MFLTLSHLQNISSFNLVGEHLQSREYQTYPSFKEAATLSLSLTVEPSPDIETHRGRHRKPLFHPYVSPVLQTNPPKRSRRAGRSEKTIRTCGLSVFGIPSYPFVFFFLSSSLISC